MRRKYFLIIVILQIVLAAFTVLADSSRQALTSVLERGKEFTLSNGLKVIMLTRRDAPIFSAVLAVRVGGVDEVQPKTGISHMLEHMAFKGTTTIGAKDFKKEKPLLDELEVIARRSDSGNSFSPEDQRRWNELQKELFQLWDSESFTRMLEEKGASGLNATTDKEFTTYFVKMPKSAFEYWAQLEAGRIVDPVMRQFYQEREVVREERRMRSEDDPIGKLFERYLETAFTTHPYRFPVIGYDNEIKRLMADELYEFHKRFYVASNMVLSLVGDVDESDLPVIEKYFSKIPEGEKLHRSIPIEPHQTEERSVTISSPNTSIVIVGYKKPVYPDENDPRISLAGEILAGSSLSPLYQTLVEERGVASSIDHDETPGIIFPNLLSFGIEPKSSHTPTEVLTAFDEELRKVLTRGFSEAEVSLAKRATARDFVSLLQSSMGMARILAHASLAYGDWRSLLTWFDEVMKATPEEVTTTARAIFKNSSRTTAILQEKK